MPFIAIFFAVSGFCSLVYQVAWLRITMADFGVTSTMTAIVLSVFMAGLSFGSWGGGRVAATLRLRTPEAQLRLYGTIEGIIGLSGVISAPLLHFGRNVVSSGIGMEWGSGGYYLLSGIVVLVALLPFCLCMGATFPLAMAAVRGAYPARSETSFSYLYLANLCGAVIGCCTTAFVFIELLGFRKTMLVAVGLNMLVAVAAFALSRRLPARIDSAETEGQDGAPKEGSPRGGSLYAVLVATGVAGMALEVVWVRQFTLFLGPVVYTFATILSLFLLANYAGTALYRTMREHPMLRHGNRFLGLLAAAAGFAALLTLLTADYRLPVSPDLVGGILRVAAGVIPFGMIIGFITPWVVDSISGGSPEKAGTAYAVNGAGCILGPLVAGFVLLPAVGERWSVLILASLLMLLVPLLLATGPKERPADAMPLLLRRPITLMVATGLLLVFFTKGYENRYPGSLLMRDHTATVIAAGAGWDRQLLVNGYGMTELTPITKVMVHLPLTMHATPPANGLVLCFGMGTSFRSMLSWGIPSTVVELVPSIPKLLGYYHADAAAVLADSHARIIVDDARRYLNRTADRYDVIMVDPPPPFEAAASSLLYSREFYREVIKSLAPGGVFHQWTDVNDPYALAAVTKSLIAEFPHVRAFNGLEGWGMHFIASMEPLPDRSPEELASLLPPRAAADLVEWGPYVTPVEQLSKILSSEHDVRELVNAVPAARAIEDDRPVNEYYLLRRHFRMLGS